MQKIINRIIIFTIFLAVCSINKMIDLNASGFITNFKINFSIEDGHQFWKINNYENYKASKFQITQIFYLSQIFIGTPSQKFDFILDTGSSDFWVLGSKCSQCKKIDGLPVFQSKNSTTYVDLSKRKLLSYISGWVKGDFASDYVQFDNFKVFANIVVIDDTSVVIDKYYSGLIGLSNKLGTKSIIDIAYKNGLLVSPIFAFKLGVLQLNQKSYFYYNISQSELTQINFIKLYNTNSWSLPLKYILINNQKISANSVSIDTGSSISIFNYKLYKQILPFFQRDCQPLNPNQQLQRCKCESELYPNITFVSDGIELVLTPDMYLYGYGISTTVCYLQIVFGEIDYPILGTNFLQHFTVFFDKLDNQIGFQGNFRKVDKYISSGIILSRFKLMQFLIILGTIIALCSNKTKKRQLKAPLNAPNQPVQASIQMQQNFTPEV